MKIKLVVLMMLSCGMFSAVSATPVPLMTFNSSTSSEVLEYDEGLSAGSGASGLSVVDIVNGGTYNVMDGATLTLTGLGDDGDTATSSFMGYPAYTQKLQSGTFEFKRNSDDAVLLQGDIAAMMITGTEGQSSSWVWTLDWDVTYTGGLILTDSTNGYSIGDKGSLSWSLTILSSGDPEITPSSQLQPFTAYASGQLSIPEPATLGLLVVGGCVLIYRRRRA